MEGAAHALEGVLRYCTTVSRLDLRTRVGVCAVTHEDLVLWEGVAGC